MFSRRTAGEAADAGGGSDDFARRQSSSSAPKAAPDRATTPGRRPRTSASSGSRERRGVVSRTASGSSSRAKATCGWCRSIEATQNVTNDQQDEREAAVSPDGKWIAFKSLPEAVLQTSGSCRPTAARRRDSSPRRPCRRRSALRAGVVTRQQAIAYISYKAITGTTTSGWWTWRPVRRGSSRRA